MIMAHHGIPYVATAAVSHVGDLQKKVEKAAGMRGFRYIHVLTPCPTGWGYPPAETIKISTLAVKSGVFPLYEIVNGILTLTYKPQKLQEMDEYFHMQRRFATITEEELEHVREAVARRWEQLIKGGCFFG
jgi:pyruvate ferredoxin oxidoreductase beta subunit